MTRLLVGLYPGTAAGQPIINFCYRLLPGAALHHPAAKISFATPLTLMSLISEYYYVQLNNNSSQFSAISIRF